MLWVLSTFWIKQLPRNRHNTPSMALICLLMYFYYRITRLRKLNLKDEARKDEDFPNQNLFSFSAS